MLLLLTPRGKADFQSLIRSYPHMPCFRRVCGVVNLCHVASNASSLRGKPADEKASLSRLCNLVLGESSSGDELHASRYGMVFGYGLFFRVGTGFFGGTPPPYVTRQCVFKQTARYLCMPASRLTDSYPSFQTAVVCRLHS